MVKNGEERIGMVGIRWECLVIEGYGGNWWGMVGNGGELCELDGNCWEWGRMFENRAKSVELWGIVVNGYEWW